MVPMPMIVAMSMTMRIIKKRWFPATVTRTDENLSPSPVMVMPAMTRPKVPAVEPTTSELVPAVSRDLKNFLTVSLSWGAPKMMLQTTTKMEPPKAMTAGEYPKAISTPTTTMVRAKYQPRLSTALVLGTSVASRPFSPDFLAWK